MVRKCAVLLGIKDFQQCAGRIAAVVFGKFVDFVQHHDRVGYAASLHGFHNPAWHRPHVSPAVSADLGFIPDTAETDPHVLSPERAGDTLSDAGLAGAGSSDKEENGAVLFSIQSHDRKLLDDAVFYFLKPVVVLIQYLFRPFQINGRKFRRFP